MVETPSSPSDGAEDLTMSDQLGETLTSRNTPPLQAHDAVFATNAARNRSNRATIDDSLPKIVDLGTGLIHASLQFAL